MRPSPVAAGARASAPHRALHTALHGAREILGAATWALLVAGLTACGGFDTPDGGSTGGFTTAPPPTTYGFGKPALELTINGVHYGPSAPAAGSVASLVTTYDELGQAMTSAFSVNASTAAGGAACSIGVQRNGNAIAPIRAASYTFATSDSGDTRDGTVVPISGEAFSSSSAAFQCYGSECDGSVLVLTTLNASHVEGYLAGNFAGSNGGAAAAVTCSFYIPMGTYTP